MNNIPMPRNVMKNLDNDYIERMEEVRKDIEKQQAKYFDVWYARASSKDLEVMSLSHPLRIKWIGIMPIQIELGFPEEAEASMYALTALSKPQVGLHHIVANLIKISHGFRKCIGASIESESSTNLGGVDCNLYAHRFFAKGAKYFEATDMLTKQLEKTDCSDSPCRHLIPPFNVQYIACDADFEISNPESGQHEFEGCYINRHNIPEAEVAVIKRQKAQGTIDPEAVGSLLWYALETGYVDLDAGPIVNLDFMATGSPKGKENVMDDATYSFGIILQDMTKPIKEVIDFHCEYYRHKFHQNLSMYPEMNYQGTVMQDIEIEQFNNVINIMTKILLFINNEPKELERSMGATRLKNEIKRSLSRIKAKALKERLSKTVDKYIVDSSRKHDFMQECQSKVGQVWKHLLH